MATNRRNDAAFAAASFIFALLFLVLLRLSNFSASTVVNFQNYMIESMILSTAGMGTVDAVAFIMQPFMLVFLSLAFLAASMSVLAVYGFSGSSNPGKFAALPSAAAAFVLFQSVWGAFLALAIFVCLFSCAPLAGVYGKELKRFVSFRLGSAVAGRLLTLFTVVMALGVFLAVLFAQSHYEASFREELANSAKIVVLSAPGASLIPASVLDAQIESAINSSGLFQSYIRWLPVTSAVSVWFVMEILRNLILSNIAGLLTHAMLKFKQLREL